MRHGLLKRAAALTALLLLLAAVVPVFGSAVPDKPGEVLYVVDTAEVISPATEAAITAKGNALFALTGAQITVLTVADADLFDLEEYAYEIFNRWGIGSSERNNGVLLVMNTATEDYWITAGYGIDDILNANYLQTALDKYLEPDFAKADYDAGAAKIYQALAEKLAKFYDEDLDRWDGVTYLFDEVGGQSSSRTYSDPTAVYVIGKIFLILIILYIVLFVVIVIASVVVSKFNRWSYFFGGSYYGSSPSSGSVHIGTSSSPGYHSSGFSHSSGTSHSYHSSGSSHSYHSSGSHSSHSFGGGGSHGGGAGRH